MMTKMMDSPHKTVGRFAFRAKQVGFSLRIEKNGVDCSADRELEDEEVLRGMGNCGGNAGEPSGVNGCISMSRSFIISIKVDELCLRTSRVIAILGRKKSMNKMTTTR